MDDFPIQLEELKKAVNAKNAPLVERMAHTLKGAAANIEANILRGLALEIETAGKEKRPLHGSTLWRRNSTGSCGSPVPHGLPDDGVLSGSWARKWTLRCGTAPGSVIDILGRMLYISDHWQPILALIC